MSSGKTLTIEEELTELDHKLHRLKIEYDQYFLGAMKREPFVLRGDVQRTITRFMSSPPRRPALKFRLNSITARFHSFRSLWGRTIREIEAGTYKRHRFRQRLQEQAEPEAPRASAAKPAAGKRAGGSAVDRLYDALVNARQKTGEGADVDRKKLTELVRKQAQQLKRKYGDSKKVSFKIVIEDNKAKLKASVRDA